MGANRLFDGPVHPGTLLGGAGQAGRIVGKHRAGKIVNDRVVQVGVGRQVLRATFFVSSEAKLGTVQRIEVDFAVLADDAELVAGNV